MGRVGRSIPPWVPGWSVCVDVHLSKGEGISNLLLSVWEGGHCSIWGDLARLGPSEHLRVLLFLNFIKCA